MTKDNKQPDPFDIFGELINGALGNPLGGSSRNSRSNPLVDVLFSQAEKFVRNAEEASRPTPSRPQPEPAKASPSEPKPEASKEHAPKHASDEPFGGFDLPGTIDDAIAFGQGTFQGLGNMLGLDKKAADPFAMSGFANAANVRTAPPLDIVAKETSIEYRFAVAGVKPENVSVELDAEILTVTINTPENTAGKENSDEVYLVQEIWSGNWSGEFTLPVLNKDGHKVEIDEDKVTASVKDGLVSVLVPFKERTKTKIVIS